jgi:predicted nucleotidyltransferase component of viral defense system
MKDFFETLNTLGKPKRSDIIEKDFHLHRLLNQIAQDEYLKENLVFKGGTCLIKGYLSYYRFSEDIDFTWRDASLWRGLSNTEARKRCSEKISALIEHYKSITDHLGFTFNGDKNDIKEIHISSGGRMVQFYIGYKSDIINIPSKIKIEINFVEDLIHPTTLRTLKSYIEMISSEELEFLYEDLWSDYNTKIELNCYDAEEIYIEKCRAALTRMVYKLRDVIDIYYIEREFGYSIPSLKKDIYRKIRFMLELYNRYRENIELIKLPSVDLLNDEELKLLLIETPEDLGDNISNIHEQLNAIKGEFLE